MGQQVGDPGVEQRREPVHRCLEVDASGPPALQGQRREHGERGRVTTGTSTSARMRGMLVAGSAASSPHGIQPLPKRASRCATRALHRPLTQIGTPPGCTGFGIAWMPSKLSSGDVNVARCVAPQRLAHLERVVEQAAAGAEVEPGRLVLLALPADADAEVDAAAREDVERGELLGQHRRPAQRGEQDVGAEPDPVGLRRDRGEDRERLEPVAVGTGGLAAALDAAGLGPP